MTGKMKKTREELKKLRGEREWQRRRDEAEFYRQIGGLERAEDNGMPSITPPQPVRSTRGLAMFTQRFDEA